MLVFDGKSEPTFAQIAAAYQPMLEVKAALDDGTPTDFLLRFIIGSAGAAKSVAVHQDEIRRALSDKRHRILFVRKIHKDLRNSCYKLCLDILAALGYRSGHDFNRRQSPYEIDLPNGAQLLFAGLDDIEKLKSFAGITRIVVEEASQLAFSELRGEHDFNGLYLRLRGVPVELEPTVTALTNPSRGARWMQDEPFGIDPGTFPPMRSHATKHIELGEIDGEPLRMTVYAQHTTYLDNPSRSARRQTAAAVGTFSGAMATVYGQGIFAESDAPDQLISYEDVRAAFARQPVRGKGGLGVDVGWKTDAVVLAHFEGFDCVGIDRHDPARQPSGRIEVHETATMIVEAIARRHLDPQRVVIDADGIGAGAWGNVLRDGYRTIELHSGSSGKAIPDLPATAYDPAARPVVPVKRQRIGQRKAERSQYRFADLRSFMWFFYAELLRTGRTSLPSDLDRELHRHVIEDLTAPRTERGRERHDGVTYTTIKIEPKKTIAKRLGRSTDVGDAIVYGAAVEHLKPPKAFVGMTRLTRKD